ncbi:MAG TPA: hypothetical protein VGP99_00775 [Tepidisphaeraceae bacterium]|nr:hypothetical protein [Tepidisphaeraceae bacterium]
MQEYEKPIDGADGEVERALTSLRPRLPSIDRDRLLFSAGFHSAHRKIWIWRSAAASLAAMLLVSVFIRPQTPSSQPGVGGHSNIVDISSQKSPRSTTPIEIVRNRWLEIIWSIGKEPAESPPPDNFVAIRRATQNGTAAVPIPAGNGQEPAYWFDPRLADPADQSVYQLMKRGGQSL